jgi:hypothetical protein
MVIFTFTLPGLSWVQRNLLYPVPMLKKEYSYTSTPHLGLHGLFWGDTLYFTYSLSVVDS